MTRRRVLFVRHDGRRYMTCEFNGDKAEFERLSALFGSQDSCDKTWAEICRDIWAEVRTYEDFVKASANAQGCYHSCLGDGIPIAVRNVPRNRRLPLETCDEILALYEGGETCSVYRYDAEAGAIVSDTVIPLSEYIKTIER